MSAFVVACPGCGTQFRVTQAHLAPAKGLVRCGACLTVFRAEDVRVDAAPQPVAETGEDRERQRPHASRHRSVLAREHAAMPGPRLREQDAALAELPEDDQRAPPRLEEITLPAEAERVEAALEQQRRAQVRRPGARWLVCAGLLVLVAAAEVLWLRFDALAEAPATRPLALRLCEVVGCALPSRRDVDAIRSRRLVVRSHPGRPDGLRVDAVIVNRAPWPQAFPDVELRFSDMEGRLLAARRFAPGEYLAGELAGRREMPMAAPVQISFELLDPGPDAVNYEMRLY